MAIEYIAIYLLLVVIATLINKKMKNSKVTNDVTYFKNSHNVKNEIKKLKKELDKVN